jgi:hypothetical protein
MKNQSVKNIDIPPINLTGFPRFKVMEVEHDTPMRIDLKIKLVQNNQESHPSGPKTRKPNSKSKEDEL